MARKISLFHNARRVFGASDRFGPAPFQALNRSFELAFHNVRYFYLASALFAWMQMMSWHQTALGNPPLDPVWPILWLPTDPLLPLVDILGVTCASSAILAFWKPQVTVFRAAFAILLLLCSAIPASLGAINHGEHEWFWVAFVFIFLPKAADRPGRLAYCLTFGAAQALVLMFYSLAGFWKLLFGSIAWLLGVPGNFSPGALAWTLADRMAQTGTQPLLAPFFVDHSWLAWPMFLGLIYAQLVALVIAFRPSLHLAWAAVLIGFHTGTFLLMEIAFPTHIFFLMLLLVASPFQRTGWFQPKTLLLLPIFGDLYSAFSTRLRWREVREQACPT